MNQQPYLDLLLKSRCWECLHDFFGWFCSDFDLLAKHVSHSCFCSWLHARFDAAQPWNAEDASLLHFLCCDLNKGLEQIGAGLLLQTVLLCQFFRDLTLRQHFRGSATFHCFHWGKHVAGSKSRVVWGEQ